MNNKFKNMVMFGGFIICAILIGIFTSNDKLENTFTKGKMGQKSEVVENEIIITNDNSEENEEEKEIFVYVIGAVEKPGIISIQEGARLYEVVEKAGGFRENAETKVLNLAQIVKDEEKIVIPYVINKLEQNKDEEQTKINKLYEEKSQSKEGLVNINTATKEELKSLSGIGESTADKIIEYREKNKFKKIEDLKNVSGIGDAKYNSIKDKITIN